LECVAFVSQNEKTNCVTLQETIKRNGHKRLSGRLSARVFGGTEPLVVTAVSVFAPSIRGKIEILRQQIGQLSRGLSREDTLHDILVVSIPFRLM